MTTAEALARQFHETYERLAPNHGYETREASRKPWEQVPENNRALMTAVCAEILASGTIPKAPLLEFIDASIVLEKERMAKAAEQGDEYSIRPHVRAAARLAVYEDLRETFILAPTPASP